MEHDKHPAKPEQEESFEKGAEHGRFSEGQEELPDSPDKELKPDFARGLRHGEPGEERRFSEGEEELPDSPEKHREGRFSEGIEGGPPEKD